MKKDTDWLGAVFMVIVVIMLALSFVGHVIIEYRMTPEQRKQGIEIPFVW
jgi:hypothetical protein